MADIYKKYLNENASEHMKASESTKIRGIEEGLAIWLLGSIVFGFVWVILLVAFLLWTNKITLFLSISTTILLAPIVLLFCHYWVLYQKVIKEINEKYEGTNK